MNVSRMTQLTVYLENRIGALSEICRVIEKKKINLLAICAIDMVEEAVLRIVPEDQKNAAEALKEIGMHVLDTEVLAVELPNVPGATGRMASLLSNQGINIDYIYASAHPEEGKAVLILRTHELKRAEYILMEQNL